MTLSVIYDIIIPSSHLHQGYSWALSHGRHKPKSVPVHNSYIEEFGNPVLHPPCTGYHTLTAICKTCKKCCLQNYKSFLKAAKALFLNDVMELFWMDWPLSCPLYFLHIEFIPASLPPIFVGSQCQIVYQSHHPSRDWFQVLPSPTYSWISQIQGWDF